MIFWRRERFWFQHFFQVFQTSYLCSLLWIQANFEYLIYHMWILKLIQWMTPNLRMKLCGLRPYAWVYPDGNTEKLTIDFQFPWKRFELGIIKNDFWSSTIWACRIRLSLTEVNNSKNPGIQPRHALNTLLIHRMSVWICLGSKSMIWYWHNYVPYSVQ